MSDILFQQKRTEKQFYLLRYTVLHVITSKVVLIVH